MLQTWEQRKASEANAKQQLIARLKEHGALLDENMEDFKCDAISSYRTRRQAKGGRPMMTRDKKRRQREIEDAFHDIPLYDFIPIVVDRIKSHIPNGRRIQVYEKVLEGIPEPDEGVPSNKPLCNPREKPETPFSLSRADPAKSNAELIDSLALATDMEADVAVAIRGQITWWDSADDKGKTGWMRGGVGTVSGGRLNRDHMLGDVPNHYVRDRLMDYINSQLEESKRKAACAAVFPDLGPSELEQYSALIAKKREADELEVINANKPLDRASKDRMRQTRAMESIDHNIDLTPRPGFHFRDYSRPYAGKIRRSVIRPGVAYAGAAQEAIDVGTDIDLDCDQVRALIKRFTRAGEWYVDEFRCALGAVTRPTMIAFLEMRGPEAGKQSIVYQLAWEFFRTRERLGLPLEWPDGLSEGSGSSGESGEDDDTKDNRGTKRLSSGGDRETGTTTTKKRARTRKSAAS
ncbi:hypothetical protein F5X96DRAFT_69656 [Biscogniauxia mediterranea]|nr:hypothetical protein F5X96DRAFT_69656 [Biscogniauxia mediterranea]